MKSLPFLLVALSIGSLPAAGALAQGQPNAPATSQTTGSTSSGASNASGSTTSGSTATPAPSSGAGRPETATGLGLNGPAVRYPSGKAPE